MKSPASEPGLRRFVSSSLSVSPCPPECYFQSEMKIEPDLRFKYSIDIFLGFHNVVIHVNFCGRFSGQENAFDERNRENGSDLDHQPQDQSVN